MIQGLLQDVATSVLINVLFPLSLFVTVYLLVRVGLDRIVAWSAIDSDPFAGHTVVLVRGFALANAFAVLIEAVGWFSLVPLTAGTTTAFVLAAVTYRLDRSFDLQTESS